MNFYKEGHLCKTQLAFFSFCLQYPCFSFQPPLSHQRLKPKVYRNRKSQVPMFSLCSLTKGPRIPCPWFDKGCTFGHEKTDLFFFPNPLWHLLNVQAVHSPSGHNVILLAQRKQIKILRKPIETAPQKHVPRKKEKAGKFL